MRIGIITFHWANNYGAVIQSYASRRYLETLGHEVQILNYSPTPTTSRFSLVKQLLGRSPKACIDKWIRLAWKRRFNIYRKDKLCLFGTPVNDKAGLEHLAQNLDILITGSDQVWNPVLLDEWKCFDAYLLNFGPPTVKRVSYAASLGHSSMDTIAPWKETMSSLLRQMDAISVREKTGEAIVKELIKGIDVEVVGDPTLLLNADDYRREFSRPWKKLPKTFSYILHGQDQSAKVVISQVAAYFGASVPLCNLTDTTVRNGYVRPSPDEWLQRIDQAECVVTNSFHATVFCLLFHTPFIVLPVTGSWSAMNSRVIELLAKTGLLDRLVDPEQAQDINPVLRRQIDWQIVDQEMMQLRETGESFLLKVCGEKSI